MACETKPKNDTFVKNHSISLHTSPIVVVQLRLICSSPICGSSRILATKVATIERPASLRANLEKMAAMRKEKRLKNNPLTDRSESWIGVDSCAILRPKLPLEWKGTKVLQIHSFKQEQDLRSQPGWSSEKAPAATPNNL